MPLLQKWERRLRWLRAQRFLPWSSGRGVARWQSQTWKGEMFSKWFLSGVDSDHDGVCRRLPSSFFNNGLPYRHISEKSIFWGHSLYYLVVEKKVSSLKLVSTESVISLNLVQHPRPGKDQDWVELKKPNQVIYCLMASVTMEPGHIGDASWSRDRHPKIDHIWHWGVTKAGQQ